MRDAAVVRTLLSAFGEGEARFRRVSEAAGLAAFEVGSDSVAEVSPAFRMLYGLPPGARVDFATMLQVLHPEDRARVVADHARLAVTGGHFNAEFRVVLPDGSIRWIETRGEATPGPGGMPSSLRGINLDVTARKEIERQLALQQAQLESILESTTDSVFTLDRAWRFTYLNRRAMEQLALGRTLVGATIWDAFPEIRNSCFERAYRGAMFERKPAEAEEHYAPLGRTFVARAFPGVDGGIVVFFRDVTELRRAAEEQRAVEARFRAAVEATRGVVWTNTPRGEMEGEQPGWAGLTGQSYADYQGFGWAAAVHPEDAQPTIDAWVRSVASRTPFVFEHRVRRADGAWRRFAIRAIPVIQPDGAIREWVGVHTDVTDQREAEAVLARDRDELERLVEARTRDLRQTEARLSQAEKLTALGQLAGGIAHDFNNVLQSIQGCAALLRRRADSPDEIARLVTMMERATDRGASVTRRLLAFARRDDAPSAAVSVPELVTGMCELFRHTLGRAFSIVAEVEEGLPQLQAERGQLETVLINLATNARDAMPDGGTLTVSAHAETVAPEGRALPDANGATALPLPGDYVRLGVADTGTGMTADLLARVTEPFFTTKRPGKGTGLGLSMAKAFVEQSGGALTIRSAPGHGTIVLLWLPAAC